MRPALRLGAANAALIAVYFAPVWGLDAWCALRSPYYGFEYKAHAVAASYYRAMFELGLDGLGWTSSLLAGLKLVIAVAFLAYLVDFARALMVGRDPDRATLDAVLLLAGGAIMLWAWPGLRSGDPALIRLHATEFLLLCGAMIVIAVERRLEEDGVSAIGAVAPGRSAGLPLRVAQAAR
ncbi:MAG: hypothetical protein IT537_23415 [Hyphomicrobiales bacterium]|nr:hypothetical protein [Hyphomicrobiales bacterium]